MPKPSLLLDNNAEVVVLQRIFDGSRDAIAILAPDGRYLHQNPSHRELLGYSDQEIVRSTAAVHLGEQNARAIRHAVAESGQFTGEITSQTRDGDEKLLDVTVFPVHDDDGQVICAVAVGRDVTEVRMNQRRLDTVLRGTSGLIGEEYFRAMTEQVARVLGVRSATVGAFIAEEEAELMAVWLDGEHRNSGMVLPCNGLPCHHVKETGEPLMLRSLDGFDVDLPWPVGAYIALPVRDETREVIGFLSIMNDESVQHQELAVSLMKLYVERAGAEMRRMRDDESMRRLTRELEQANAELQTLVNHDPITRLLNRNGLGQVLSTELRRARNGSDLQAILVDCDDFSEVNEQLGFAVGDIVLREIGKRLREASRDCDVVARVGGDEFVIILPDTSLARAGRVAERLRLAVASTPVIITQDVVKVTVSMGVATVPSNASTLEEILTLAYGSLHSSKQDGKNRVSSNDWPAAAPAQDADGCFNRSPSSPRLTEIGEQLLVGKGIRAVKQSIVDLDTEREVGW